MVATIFGRPTLGPIGPLSVLSVCQSVLSVTLVYCGQTVVWIQAILRMDVGLAPGDIVLDGDPAHPSPIFGPFLLWPNGGMHQYATWYGSRSQPMDFVVNGDPAPPQKGSGAPIFGPCLLRPNGWVDQNATWY